MDRLTLVTDADVVPVLDGVDIWDSWPVRDADGAIADLCGREVWVALAAPAGGDPALRHDIAELRTFIAEDDNTFTDLGPLFGDNEPLGTRQWAGSTVLDDDRVWAYYTSAGTVSSEPPGFRQRLTVATATLRCEADRPRFDDWSDHVEFDPDPRWYDLADQATGEPGRIKAFRDPSFFRDPSSGDEYLLYTASMSQQTSSSEFNGAIGVARRTGEADWLMLEPIITADSVNNELERPHVVVVDDRYYLFFSTQGRTFHPDIVAPTGLYGFVADELLGPYVPLNGHGLVFSNPPERPVQIYSWLVLNDLSVVGFIDGYGVGADGQVIPGGSKGRSPEFGGTFSPTVQIAVDGDKTRLLS